MQNKFANRKISTKYVYQWLELLDSNTPILPKV